MTTTASGDGSVLPTRTHEAYVALKQRIMRLDLAPGCHVTEGELAAELGWSKTPVREALARLQRDGLVESVARTGYRVAPVTLKDASDLFGLRCVLEGEAAALAAARGQDGDELLRLDELCQSSYDPGDRSSISAFLAANAQFHVRMARGSGNDRLADTLAFVIEQLERFFQLALTMSFRSDEMVHEHRELLSAVTSGDVEGARRIAVEQTRSAQAMVFQSLLDCEAVQLANLGDVKTRP